jgi:hypothetical protein
MNENNSATWIAAAAIVLALGVVTFMACGTDDAGSGGGAGSGAAGGDAGVGGEGGMGGEGGLGGEGGIGGGGVVCAGIAGLPCPEGSYCRLEVGTCCCDFQGVCATPPDACADVFDPVCGCDRQTYANECLAAQARVSIDHVGSCPAQP